jgi:hypothetical protein
MRARPLTEAVVGSDDVKVQAAGEVDVGEEKGTTFVAPVSRSTEISLKFPIVVVGVTAETVTFIDVVVERNPLAGAWRAVIVAVPALRVSRVSPSIPTTVGSELVSVHVPGEFELGAASWTRETLSIESVMSLKVPSVGVGAFIVSDIVLDPDNQRLVAACVALICTVPPSRSVTRLPETVATSVLSDS